MPDTSDRWRRQQATAERRMRMRDAGVVTRQLLAPAQDVIMLIEAMDAHDGQGYLSLILTLSGPRRR